LGYQEVVIILQLLGRVVLLNYFLLVLLLLECLRASHVVFHLSRTLWQRVVVSNSCKDQSYKVVLELYDVSDQQTMKENRVIHKSNVSGHRDMVVSDSRV
jgi:hypothetical protein